MPDPLVLPRATTRHSADWFLPVATLNVLLCVPVYAVSYFAAYAYADPPGWPEHLRFLVPVLVFSVGTGFFGSLLTACRNPESAVHVVGSGVLASAAMNATALALGSIVSATDRNQSSALAGLSTSDSVLVPVILFAVAAACAGVSEKVRRS